MFGGDQRRRRLSKVKDGDGSEIKPFRWWNLLTRSRFVIDLPDAKRPLHRRGEEPATTRPDDEPATRRYALDVNYFDDDEHVFLYRDGRQHAVSPTPAVFPVPGGVIDFAASMYGVKRVNYVPDQGEPVQLSPAPGTGEWRRARFAQRYPAISRTIGLVAIVILLASLVVLLPQVAAQISQIPPIADNLGTFQAPIQLSAEANTALTIAGVFAALERALSMRSHWLIDIDTTFMGD